MSHEQGSSEPLPLTRGIMVDLGDLMHCAEDAGLSDILSGYTYLGQFIDHDMTRSEGHDDPGQGVCKHYKLSNLVTPELDLSSVYYRGGLDNQKAADLETGKLLLGHVTGSPAGTSSLLDLPRCENNLAIIPDDRNDENLLIAQMHVQFIKLHNHFVDEHCAATPSATAQSNFEYAKQACQNCFLNIVYKDFLPTILHPDIYALFFGNASDIDSVSEKEIQTFRNTSLFFKKGKLPDEFRMAAFRYGHGMVRKTYIINHYYENLKIDELLQWTGEFNLNQTGHLPFDKVVDWRIYFDKNYTPNQSAKIILPAVSINLPDAGLPGTNLASRNLLRHIETALPDGNKTRESIVNNPRLSDSVKSFLQRILVKLPDAVINPQMGFKEENFLNLPVGSYEGLLDYVPGGEQLKKAPPLWYYCLCEAYFEFGRCLGPLASYIIAETFSQLLPTKIEDLPSSDIQSMMQLISVTQPKETKNG